MKAPFTKYFIASRIVSMYQNVPDEIEKAMIDVLMNLSDTRFLINARKST